MDWNYCRNWLATVLGGAIVVYCGQWYNHYRIEKRERKATTAPVAAWVEVSPATKSSYVDQFFSEFYWFVGNIFYVYGVFLFCVIAANNFAFTLGAEHGYSLTVARCAAAMIVAVVFMGAITGYPFSAPRTTKAKRIISRIALAIALLVGAGEFTMVPLVHPPYMSVDYFFKIFSHNPDLRGEYVEWRKRVDGSQQWTAPASTSATTQSTTKP